RRAGAGDQRGGAVRHVRVEEIVAILLSAHAEAGLTGGVRPRAGGSRRDVVAVARQLAQAVGDVAGLEAVVAAAVGEENREPGVAAGAEAGLFVGFAANAVFARGMRALIREEAPRRRR